MMHTDEILMTLEVNARDVPYEESGLMFHFGDYDTGPRFQTAPPPGVGAEASVGVGADFLSDLDHFSFGSRVPSHPYGFEPYHGVGGVGGFDDYHGLNDMTEKDDCDDDDLSPEAYGIGDHSFGEGAFDFLDPTAAAAAAAQKRLRGDDDSEAGEAEAAEAERRRKRATKRRVEAKINALRRQVESQPMNAVM